jgi:hypothetical protein
MEREQDPEKGAVVHFDVEAVLERIRLDLDVGELFASPAFDLTNAMTAMEIGDPKMDPGMHRYDQKTLSERIAGGEAPVHFDNTVDVLAIMDRLLQLEIGWHDHYMLSQTVYTCLYMMDMERWVVDVCMLAWVCLCDLTMSMSMQNFEPSNFIRILPFSTCDMLLFIRIDLSGSSVL